MMMQCVYTQKAFTFDQNFILWHSASHKLHDTHQAPNTKIIYSDICKQQLGRIDLRCQI